MHPFLNNYANQNQGYYVFIHEENSPADVPTEFPAPSGAEGLEWDEEVVESSITEREDDDWASLYRYFFHFIISYVNNLKLKSINDYSNYMNENSKHIFFFVFCQFFFHL